MFDDKTKLEFIKKIEDFIKLKKLDNLNIKTVEEYLTVDKYISYINQKDNKYEYILYRNNDNELDIKSIPTRKYEKELKIKQNTDNISLNLSNTHYMDASLDKFVKNSSDRIKAFDISNTFIKQYIKNQTSYSIYISGPNLVGKTYLASSIINLLSSQYHTIFIQTTDLSRYYKINKFERELDILIDNLKNCDILVLDNLGSEDITSAFRDEVLIPIIDYRNVRYKPSIYISNITDFRNLLKQYTLIDQITASMRLIQKIKNNCKVITLSSFDFKEMENKDDKH